MDFNPIEGKYKTQRTARYFQSSEITSATKTIVVVLHGYAMHGGIFLKKFAPLFSEENCFVAPEGLSRFYVKGTSGHVGASWMTKEDRLNEIEDYVVYLDGLVQSLIKGKSMELLLIGFSQGAATLARWYASSKLEASKIIFYAGVFPPDLIPDFESEKWTKVPIEVLVGEQDEYYSRDTFFETFNLLKTNNPKCKFNTFEGKHEINTTVLRSLLTLV